MKPRDYSLSVKAPLIRRAVASDAALLAELGKHTFQETFAEDNRPDDMAAYVNVAFTEQAQALELADENTLFFIAEIGAVPVGYAKLRTGDAPSCVRGDDPIELARLYITSQWFGLGVGDALMQACTDEARRQGRKTMWLGVWERNMRAQAFYRKWEFRVVGDHIFQLGADPQTDLVMERAL
jgi:diamine N-acetyltransferase